MATQAQRFWCRTSDPLALYEKTFKSSVAAMTRSRGTLEEPLTLQATVLQCKCYKIQCYNANATMLHATMLTLQNTMLHCKCYKLQCYIANATCYNATMLHATLPMLQAKREPLPRGCSSSFRSFGDLKRFQTNNYKFKTAALRSRDDRIS